MGDFFDSQGTDAFGSDNALPDFSNRPNRINKKALEELPADGGPRKILSVFLYNKQGHKAVPSLSVPLDVAKICADKIAKHQHGGLYTIGRGSKEGEIPSLEAFKVVFDWMNECGRVNGLAPDPDVAAIIASSEDTTANASLVIDVMKAADYIGIPEASFNKFLKKKLAAEAKNFLVSLDDVESLYKNDGDMELRIALSKSIFENWFNYNLDGEEYFEYMERLSDLRDQYGDLHQDIHDRLEDKDRFLKAARQKREEKKAEEAANNRDDDGGFNGGDFGVTNNEYSDGNPSNGWNHDGSGDSGVPTWADNEPDVAAGSGGW